MGTYYFFDASLFTALFQKVRLVSSKYKGAELFDPSFKHTRTGEIFVERCL
jgi:hypothetical protein